MPATFSVKAGSQYDCSAMEEGGGVDTPVYMRKDLALFLCQLRPHIVLCCEPGFRVVPASYTNTLSLAV